MGYLNRHGNCLTLVLHQIFVPVPCFRPRNIHKSHSPLHGIIIMVTSSATVVMLVWLPYSVVGALRASSHPYLGVPHHPK